MSVIVITPPDELITAEEAAEFLRIDALEAETDTLEAMITAAREWCEEYLRRAIGIQTLEVVLDGFPTIGKQGIFLRSPAISIVSFNYTDTNGDEQEFSDYVFAADAQPAEIRPVSSWPATINSADSVRVRYTAGYQNTGSPTLSQTLPKTIRTAMLMQIADLYENREAQVERPLTINPTLERMLSQYRLEMGI